MSDPDTDCPFCHLTDERVRHSGTRTVGIRDAFPVSPGHTLIIPRRHVASFFDVTPEERDDILQLLARAKTALDDEFKPDGYNVGINDGAAAGQTVPHLHVHLIPRYDGDREDPRGGVRWVLPDKAAYWNES
jgi:diadenosine tetraphosphate (Ap4A) HIT family hydrolase